MSYLDLDFLEIGAGLGLRSACHGCVGSSVSEAEGHVQVVRIVRYEAGECV